MTQKTYVDLHFGELSKFLKHDVEVCVGGLRVEDDSAGVVGVVFVSDGVVDVETERFCNVGCELAGRRDLDS